VQRYLVRKKISKIKRNKKLEPLRESEDDARDENDSSHFTDSTFQMPVFSGDRKDRLRKKFFTSLVTQEPSVVFDFRFMKYYTKLDTVNELIYNMGKVISANMNTKRPFNLHICNFDRQGQFSDKYQFNLGFDDNLIYETSQSYIDKFPKEKLIYLSENGDEEMREYDPDKVYIIGAMVDTKDFSQVSWSRMQAIKDGIRSERLPLKTSK
jgi:Trm5-related predicted tRNA methylase